MGQELFDGGGKEHGPARVVPPVRRVELAVVGQVARDGRVDGDGGLARGEAAQGADEFLFELIHVVAVKRIFDV